MQVVSGCCIDKVARPILLGLCGCYDPDDLNNLVKISVIDKGFGNFFEASVDTTSKTIEI